MLKEDWKPTAELRYKRMYDEDGKPTGNCSVQQKFQRGVYDHNGKEFLLVDMETKWEEPPTVD